MKRYIKASRTTNETIKEWYPPEQYTEWNPRVWEIDWTNVNPEDVECVAGDDADGNIDLSNVKSVRYVNDEEQAALEDMGYEGGYVFTTNDGGEKTYAWRPYPRNLNPIERIVWPQ